VRRSCLTARSFQQPTEATSQLPPARLIPLCPRRMGPAMPHLVSCSSRSSSTTWSLPTAHMLKWRSFAESVADEAHMPLHVSKAPEIPEGLHLRHSSTGRALSVNMPACRCTCLKHLPSLTFYLWELHVSHTKASWIPLGAVQVV
jgi:hypothetical protein